MHFYSYIPLALALGYFFCFASANGGGERRMKFINLNCDPNEVTLKVYGHDWLNDNEEILLFEFIDRRGSQGFNPGNVILPPTAVDPGATNDGNTFYYSSDYYEINDEYRPFVTYSRPDGGVQRVNIIINQLKNRDSVYISCSRNSEGSFDVRLVSQESYTIVGYEDSKSYAIKDVSCSGGIRVYGASGRFYGSDYPGVSRGVSVPEWDYPVQICKADRLPFSDCKFVNRHEGQGRNVYCIGRNNWSLTGDYTLGCLNNCPLGKFDENYVFDKRYIIQSTVNPLGTSRSRTCIHSDNGDKRVKMIECTQYEGSQEMIFNCDSESCSITNRDNGLAITIDGDMNVIWQTDRASDFPQQHRFVIQRNGSKVWFKSLLQNNKCLTHYSNQRQLRFEPCEIGTPFLVDESVLQATPEQPMVTRPKVTIFQGNSQYTDSYSYDDDYSFVDIQPSYLGTVTTISYCGGALYLYDENLNLFYYSPQKSRFEQRQCYYVYLTTAQRMVSNYVFIPSDRPIEFPEIHSDAYLAFFDRTGNVLEYNEQSISYTNIPTAWINKIEKITFCARDKDYALLVILGSTTLEYRPSRNTCVDVDARQANFPADENFLFSYI